MFLIYFFVGYPAKMNWNEQKWNREQLALTVKIIVRCAAARCRPQHERQPARVRELAAWSGQKTGFSNESCVWAQHAQSKVRLGCVRCLDSLCHSWHTKNRPTLHIYGPKSVLILCKVADKALNFIFGEYRIIFKHISIDYSPCYRWNMV